MMEAEDEGLSEEQLDYFEAELAARKRQLLEEIREALRREGADERYDQIVGAAGRDAGDGSVADLTRDLTNAQIDRDTHELLEINDAQNRIAKGQYGYCIECGAFIGLARLEAYPTARRCLLHQQLYEKTHGSPRH